MHEFSKKNMRIRSREYVFSAIAFFMVKKTKNSKQNSDVTRLR